MAKKKTAAAKTGTVAVAPKGGLRHMGKTYRTGEALPARYQRLRPQGEVPHDPAAGIDDAPPNFGRFPLPQIITFQGLQSTVARVYRNPDEAVKHNLDNARIMRNDCSIMECLEARQRATALLNWHLEPEDKDDPKQQELCADLTAIISRTRRFTEYRRSLLEALWYGRAANEHRFGFQTVRGKRRIVIENWLPIHGDKLAFRYDDGSGKYSGNEVGIRVGLGHHKGDVIAGDRKVEITDFGAAYFLEPWERSMVAIHRHIIEDGAFEDVLSAGRIHGVGIRDRIYWCWFQKQETMAQLMEVIERTGTGFTIYYYPYGNPEAREKMQEVAEQQARTNVILMPRMGDDASMDSFGIDRIEPSTAGIDAMRSIIHEFFGHQIKRYILGQVLSSEAAATGLGSGVADLHMDSLYQIVDYDATNLEETLTHELVQPLKSFNFPWARDIYIRFKIDTKSSESQEKLQAAKTAWDMGAKIKSQDVMDLIGFSMPTEDDEVLQNPQFMQQQRLWEQAHGGGQPQAEPGSIEDMFGPLAGLLGQDGGQVPEGDEDDGPDGLGVQRYRKQGDGGIAPIPSLGGPQQGGAHRVGETKSIGGRTYRLNENHRWERTDNGEEAAGEHLEQLGGHGEAPDPHAAKRHEFVASKLKTVDKQVAGMLRAFHESPEYKRGGAYTTKDFHKKQAGSLYQWLTQNAGKTTGGGQIVDLGDGRMGFASEAGSMIVWPADENGKYEISYTNRTGIVDRGAGLAPGAEPKASPEQPAVPGQQPGQPTAQPVTPGAEPVAELDDPAPPTAPEEAEAPAAEHGQPAPQDQPMQAEVIDDGEGGPLSPPAATPKHVELRKKADEHRAKLDEAVAAWEKSRQVNADPKVMARHRSNVAALRAIWRHHDDEARRAEKDHEKHRKAVAKAEEEARKKLGIDTSKPAKSSKQYRDEFAEKMDQNRLGTKRAWKAGMNTGSVEFESDDHRDLHDLGAKMARQTRAKNFSDADRKELGKAREALKQRLGVDDATLSQMARDVYKSTKQQTKGIADGEHRKLKMPTLTAEQPADDAPLLDQAEKNPGGGNVPEASPEALERMKLSKQHRRLLDYAEQAFEKHGIQPSDANRKLIADAVKKGRLKTPADVRQVLRTAKKLHSRGDQNAEDTPHVKEALNRKAKREGRQSWQAITKQKAAEWDMKPEEFDSLAREVFSDWKQHHEAREMAKQAARKATGLSQADIYRLENQGFDSGSDHPRTRGLDDIGRQLASHFPELGWGRGADSEEGGNDDFDYGESLWHLIREGKGSRVSRTSPEFLSHIDEYLQSQLASAGSGSDDGEDWSHVPFAKLIGDYRKSRYAKTQPTEAQREAGNYKKGHIRLHGLQISIENEKGTKRRPEWPTLAADYGYIRRTEGSDGDHVDVYVGPEPESEVVFVIDQPNKDGGFDEHKCMVGWTNEDEATAAYLKCYTPGWKLGPVTTMTIDQFKAWLEDGDTTTPVADQVSRYARKAIRSSPGQKSMFGDHGTGRRTDWDELKHPRNADGKFAKKGDNRVSSSPKQMPLFDAAEHRKEKERQEAEYRADLEARRLRFLEGLRLDKEHREKMAGALDLTPEDDAKLRAEARAASSRKKRNEAMLPTAEQVEKAKLDVAESARVQAALAKAHAELHEKGIAEKPTEKATHDDGWQAHLDAEVAPPMSKMKPEWFHGVKTGDGKQVYHVTKNDDGTYNVTKSFVGGESAPLPISTGKDAEDTMNNIWRSGTQMTSDQVYEHFKAGVLKDREVAAEPTANAPKPVAEPEPQPEAAPDLSGPLTLAAVAEHQQAIRSGKANAEQIKNWFEQFHADPSAVKEELNKKTVAELKKMGAGGWRANSMKKAELVNDMLTQIGEQYHVGESYTWSHGEDRLEALRKAVHRQTDDHVKAYAEKVAASTAERKQKIEAHVKALQNPETLDDFRKVERAGGLDKLTAEQRAKYDELQAIDRRAKEAASKSTVTGLHGGEEKTGSTGIVKGHHQKRNQPTWTVTVENRLGEEGFHQAVTRARQLGGSYVNARVAKAYGATAGFQFFDEEKAKQFQEVLSGKAVDKSADVAAQAEERAKATAEKLKAAADSLGEAADAKLNAGRKTNTARRAAMAARAEADARKEAATAKTIGNIAEAMEKGEVKHLGGIREKTHVEALDRALWNAKYRRYQMESREGKTDLSYEDYMAQPHSAEDVDAVEYPYPKLWASDLKKHAGELSKIPGLKKIGAKLAKAAEQKVKFRGQAGGMKLNGGQVLTLSDLAGTQAGAILKNQLGDKAIRVHASYDWRLAQQKPGHHGAFYTADAGETWGTTPVVAVHAALSRGKVLDTIDKPEDRLISLTDPGDIHAFAAAASKLRRSNNRDAKRLGDTLHDRIENYHRMHAMDIKSPAELRAALREYLPFKQVQDKADPVKAKERALIGQKIPGFFPTPRSVIDQMLSAADIHHGQSVLEPSAGKGDILDAIREAHSDAETHAIEPHSSLREIIGLKGHNLVGSDFLEHDGQYDRIVMNPPFENRQDVAHVRHAFKLLKPGGRVVAIMSAGPFHGSQKRDVEFREWLDSVGGSVEDLPEGSFAGNDAFRQTGVNTKLVVIDKDSGPARYQKFNEADHPRDDDGKFIDKDEINAAKDDPWAADELRKRVTDPGELAKLESHIGSEETAMSNTPRRKEWTVDDANTFAHSVEPLHDVIDHDKLNALVEHFEEHGEDGWKGRPVLAMQIGDGYKGITGSHRTHAALKARINIPVYAIDEDTLSLELDGEPLWQALKSSSLDDEDRLKIFRDYAEEHPGNEQLEDAIDLLSLEISENESEFKVNK